MCVGLSTVYSHVNYDLKLLGRFTSLNQNIYVAIDQLLSPYCACLPLYKAP